ncbi:50S ribosomal protein L13 [Ignicoccus islandicus DSM 13165]|uniref:Large ribosomal subunit protein uL13 n=1 Tax=Ignicoccus islandicus DSM 13165 TaxID=940295 RepID=A0A0U3FNT7_9CREN|nr:50S ribosomal protein L13 [Ignicoccus islandicus]ALU11639.1 50S ribosomal protein L13 [Ignicoccus islandicus DSM 13165]
MKRVVIVDGSNQILGRMASHVAKMLLDGYEVHVINAEKVVLSGEPKRVIEGYRILLNVKTHRNPYRNKIKRPRNPRALVKDAVKGMLPKDKKRGREALGRLRVYVGVPQLNVDAPIIKFPDADSSRLSRKFITVGEVTRRLGWRGEM